MHIWRPYTWWEIAEITARAHNIAVHKVTWFTFYNLCEITAAQEYQGIHDDGYEFASSWPNFK